MFPDRYYVADVQEGPKLRRLYFYASVEGLTDPEYGYTEDDSWIEPAYGRVVDEVEKRLSVQPWGFAAVPGADVTVSEPREISPEELVRQNPAVNGPVVNAVNRAKKEIEGALRPIRVVWHWQESDEAGGEAAVYLRLEDDTAASRPGFTLSQLRDEILTRDLIRKSYQDLLATSSRKLILNLLRQNAGAGKD